MTDREPFATDRGNDRGESPELLEWFRLDRAGGTKTLLVFGAVCVFTGCGLLSGAFLSRRTELVHLISTIGAGVLLSGLMVAFGGMALLLANDDYLAVRVDGLLLHRARGDHGTDLLIAWDDLKRVHVDGGILLLDRGDDEDAVRVTERYPSATAEELAAHLESLRRKAQMDPLTMAIVKRIAIGLPHVKPK